MGHLDGSAVQCEPSVGIGTRWRVVSSVRNAAVTATHTFMSFAMPKHRPEWRWRAVATFRKCGCKCQACACELGQACIVNEQEFSGRL